MLLTKTNICININNFLNTIKTKINSSINIKLPQSFWWVVYTICSIHHTVLSDTTGKLKNIFNQNDKLLSNALNI